MAFTFTKLTDSVQPAVNTNLALSAASALYINPDDTVSYVTEVEVHNNQRAYFAA